MGITDLNRLKQIAIFCQVIDSGSMRAAADALKMTPPAISQHIKQLEQELGLSLIHRSTRKISLSEAGGRYYQHGKRMLIAAGDAEDAVHEIKNTLEGDLRISAPVGLASQPLARALKEILSNNPGLRLTVLASDQEINLVNEQIDIAIRAGKPKESNFIFHPLQQATKHIFASPEYLKKMGTPVVPDDLAEHIWLGLIGHKIFSEIQLAHPDNRHFSYQPKYAVKLNSLSSLIGHVQEGLGIAILPELEIQHLIKSGVLVKVLPDWKMSGIPLYALTIDRKQSYKVKAVLKALQSFFEPASGVEPEDGIPE